VLASRRLALASGRREWERVAGLAAAGALLLLLAIALTREWLRGQRLVCWARWVTGGATPSVGVREARRVSDRDTPCELRHACGGSFFPWRGASWVPTRRHARLAGDARTS